MYNILSWPTVWLKAIRVEIVRDKDVLVIASFFKQKTKNNNLFQSARAALETRREITGIIARIGKEREWVRSARPRHCTDHHRA